MKTKVRLIMCIVMVLLMCINMASCSKRYKVDDYYIVRNKGEYFIIFDDVTAYQKGIAICPTPGSIDFPSMKDFKDAVTKGKLTDSQKRIMATVFERNENGAILACNFNNLFVPLVPEACSIGTVYWSGGNNYSFHLTFDNGYGSFHHLIESEYNNRYQRDYLDVFERDNIKVTSTENLDDNKVVTHYSTSSGDLKRIRYSLSDGEKTIIVDKTFRLRMDYPNLETSSDVPSGIVLYCVEGEERYVITLYGFTQDPTDEWLLSFGIEEFVDTE